MAMAWPHLTYGASSILSASKAARAYTVKTIEFSPDGTKLAVAQSDNIVPFGPHSQATKEGDSFFYDGYIWLQVISSNGSS